MDMTFCLSALEKALAQNTPKIFNSDQGSQFTSMAFTGRLEKYEEVYLKGYISVIEALRELEKYFDFYNN
jgi:putative transposase